MGKQKAPEILLCGSRGSDTKTDRQTHRQTKTETTDEEKALTQSNQEDTP